MARPALKLCVSLVLISALVKADSHWGGLLTGSCEVESFLVVCFGSRDGGVILLLRLDLRGQLPSLVVLRLDRVASHARWYDAASSCWYDAASSCCDPFEQRESGNVRLFAFPSGAA